MLRLERLDSQSLHVNAFSRFYRATGFLPAPAHTHGYVWETAAEKKTVTTPVDSLKTTAKHLFRKCWGDW